MSIDRYLSLGNLISTVGVHVSYPGSTDGHVHPGIYLLQSLQLGIDAPEESEDKDFDTGITDDSGPATRGICRIIYDRGRGPDAVWEPNLILPSLNARHR